MSFTDNYLELRKKKKKESEQKSSGSSFTDNYLSIRSQSEEDIAPVYSESIAPFSTQNVIKGVSRNAVAKKILGVSDDDISSMTLDELRVKKNEVTDRGDQVKYQSMYNQKLIEKNKEILASTKMDGTNRSVLGEMVVLSGMADSEEKEKRKTAVLKKMEELGLSTDDYALYAGDSNFSWDNFGKWAGNAAMSGLASFNKGITSTIDLILGSPMKALGWENNPVSEIADYYSDIYDSYKFKTDVYEQKLGGGKGYEFAGSAIEGTMGAVPNALLAIMSAGTSLAGNAATTTSTLATKAAYQSGNILTKAGLTVEGMMKNPQYWLSFGRTYGQDYEEAKAMGASDTSAVLGATLTSLVNAGIEIGTDGLSGIQGLPQEIAEEGGSKLLKWAISSAEEGGEEGLQKFVSEVVAKTMYDHDMDILDPKEYAKEMALGTISGIALGGGQVAAQGTVNAVNKAVYDYKDHQLTENEQKVVDKVVEDRIAEKEKDGTKLTKKEKSEIREDVFERMKKGYISTDTIEEVLGGETYKSYKSTVEAEDSVIKELAELYEGEELQQQITDLLKDSPRFKAKDQLSTEVLELVKADRLSESYRERVRRGQYFEADLSKYSDPYAKQTMKNIMEAKSANNSNRTHELANTLAKLSADKKLVFSVTDAKKLKESGYAVEGKTVNGYVDDDGNITINVESPKAWQTTVGHEITHVLEDTEFYGALQETLFEYAKSRKSKNGKFDNEYKERLYYTRQLYKNVKGYEGVEGFNKIKREVVADLVGDYLFQDADFINHLSTKHRNVFQKIYDEIKYLCRVVTAGSQEARDLEKVRKAFEDAYRADTKNGAVTEAEAETKYSIVEDQETIDFLENQEHITVYKAMVLIDGKLYPPMASQQYVEEEYTTKKGEKKTRRVRKLKNPSILGKWQQSDERPDLVTSFMPPSKKYPDGYGQFDLLKSNGKTTGGVAYNPYEHTSNIVLNDQFAEAYQRPELVTVEYKIPVSELTSGYKAQYAKDAVGLTDWKAGGVAQKLQNSHRDVYLTRWSKPVRVLDDAEVAQKYKEILDKEEGISVPWNVVTPSLRTELEKIGVPIDYSDIKAGSTIRTFDAFMRGEYDKKPKKTKKTKYSISDDFPNDAELVAKEYFGTTEKWSETGWLLRDGTQLDFSGRHWERDPENEIDLGESYYSGKRNMEHYEIAEAFPELREYSKMEYRGEHLDRFQNRGNIRIVGKGIVGIEKMPTEEQFEKLRSYFGENIDRTIVVGIGKRGLTYPEGTKPSVIIEGIRDYFSLNRRNQSDLMQFHTKYSLSDSDGNQLTEEQGEFFKDSKVRDKNGDLLKVYHGTTNKFTTFRQSKADGWGTGIYFTDNRNEASTYGDNVVEAYLNITNPYNADTMNYYDIGAENTKAYRDYDMEVWKNSYEEYDTYEEYKADGRGVDMYDIYAEEVEVFNKILRELGYDGIIADGSNGIDGMEIVAFKENQPKLTTNTKPSSSSDIRYSISAETDKNYMDAVKRGDTEAAQKMVDEVAKESGYSVKAYHGTPSFGFTVFDPAMSDDKTTLFFTESIDVAKTYAGRDVYGTKSVNDTKSFKYERGKKYTEAELKEAHDFIQSKYHVYGTTKINVEKQTVTHAGTRYSAKQIMEMADSIAKKGIYGVYLNTDGFLKVDANGKNWANMDIPDDFYEVTDNAFWGANSKQVNTRDYAKYAKAKGYRGLTITNVFDVGNRNTPVSARMEREGTSNSTIHILFDSNQVKSADPVTYDDSGNVIPLSERFNVENKDIRYSISDSNGTEDVPYRTVLENLKEYSREDLVSIADQVTDGTFTIAHSMSKDSLVNVLRETISIVGKDDPTLTFKLPVSKVEQGGDESVDDWMLDDDISPFPWENTTKNVEPNYRPTNKEIKSDFEDMLSFMHNAFGHKHTTLEEFVKEEGVDGVVEEMLTDWGTEYGGIPTHKMIDSIQAELKAELGEDYDLDGDEMLFNRLKSVVEEVLSDTKSSESDSEGNQLSIAQADFFKESKIRDRNGNLRMVYHTTQNDFTVFDKSRKGETTGDYNTYLGFFFADTPEYMSQFPEFQNGKTDTYYLNMKNPIDMNNISRQAFIDIVEATGGDAQEAADFYDSEYAEEIKRARFRGDNDPIMDMSILLEQLTGNYFDYAEFYNALKPNYERLMAKGYDGVINSLDGRGWANEYIVLDSNQAKLTTNIKPTGNPDVRYSIGEGLTAEQSELAKGYLDTKDIQYSLSAEPTHRKSLMKNYSSADSAVGLDTIIDRYDKILDIWTRLGGELNSKFLNDWNNKVERPFTVFKAQAGYKYNVELSSMCKKGVPLFEAIDTIVKKEVMKELDTDVLGKEEKEILYDILKKHHFEIPCAICYVEQARQREGVIIDAFLNGKTETNANGEVTGIKLGWNQVLDTIQKEMKANGVDHRFAFVSRDIATEKYEPSDLTMDEQTYNAFAEAVKKIANEEITRYNKASGKNRKLLKDVTPEAVKECFKGTLPSNLKIFKVLLTEPSSRFKIQNDLLYSSMTTKNLTMDHNGLYSLFNSQGGVSGYKTKQAPTVYWGEILGKKWKPEDTRKEGGVRNQSNSDFQMFTLLDQAQMYMDFTAKGYYLQAYTKVLSELKLFGLSRGKINASLIPKVVVYRNADGTVDVERTMATAGLDENGNPAYDDIEGINHNEAFMLLEDPEYSKNICGICIGYSDKHIEKLLDDNRVQQIIGFHDKTNDPDKRYRGARYAKNYNGLNEAVNNKDGKTMHIGFNPFVKKAEQKFQYNKDTESFEGIVNYNGKTYVADDIPRLAADLYLEMCAKKDYTPAYKDFSGHRNYYKLLADFGLYDSQGHYAPHRKVAYNMPDTVPYLDADGNKQYMDTEKYIKIELQKELSVRDAIAEAMADTSEEGIIPQFKAEVNRRSIAPVRNSLSEIGEQPIKYGNFYTPANELKYAGDIAPIARPNASPVVDNATVSETESVVKDSAVTDIPDEEHPIKTVKERLSAKLTNSQTELTNNQKLREESSKSFDEKIAKAQALYDSKKNKDTKVANNLKRRIERLQRLKADVDAEYAKRISDIESKVNKTSTELEKDHTKQDQLERTIHRIDKMLEYDKSELTKEFDQKREQLKDKNSYISQKASELYQEIRNLKKGVKASDLLGELLDTGFEWSSIKSALVNIKHTPSETVNVNSAIESLAREVLNNNYEDTLYNLDSEYQKQIDELEAEAETKRKNARVADQRMTKHNQYATQMEDLIGDTTTWVDKKMGIQYATNTLKRNLRDIVRDANGKRDIAKADAIYDELQGKYNAHEAMLNRESTQIKNPYAEMNITSAEDAYIQMLGEFRHNPDTTLTEDVVKEFYEKHKKHINVDKVDKAIEMARETYDTLLVRVNEVLKEQGMKEIPYRQGYFPHFTEDKQSWLAKLFNWKTRNDDIPTDIAGLTEQFNPNRSWQSFNKQRKGDTTDYSFTRGLDTYVQGALDWIYHIEDIQKRRAFENHIRYVHSEKGVQEKIDAIRANKEYDADEVQEQIDLVLKEAGNPLNNFVTDFRTGTNTLANKKSSMDRGMEQMTNRKIYSVMTNLSSRVSANMVGGSVSSALTNFIPITQSWGEVSPVSSLKAMGDTIRSTIRDDGMIDKSNFLTNRLKRSDKLYKTTWDKISEKAGLMMESIDSFTSQTVWRSKYLENISKGMSESEAIKDADQFAESVMAGRSRGNQPTIFDSKNPLVKCLTAFQLEVNNQYGYMFKDMPQDMKNESVGKLIKGYATMFMGAYAYNALYSSLVGRDSAFDPIGIIEELLRDLGWLGDDEEEEPEDIIMNLTDNILEEVPFVGGLMGGGRVPISSALPYDGLYEMLEGTMKDIGDKNWSGLTKEWLNPVYYLAMPLGGGQLKKSIQGLNMFSEEHPIAGSYTDSGALRFPVEDTWQNRLQAGLFGQWANSNAQDYISNNRSPLDEKRIQEFLDVGMTIQDYWDYREGLSGMNTLAEKADYIYGLDLTDAQKNVLINNIADRKEDIDMSDYGSFGSFDEFDYAEKNPEKYSFLKENNVSYDEYMSFDDDAKDAYNWAFQNPEKFTLSKAIVDDVVQYRKYASDLYDIRADKDSNGKTISGSAKEKKIAYINNLDLDYGQKIILFKSLYESDDTYNYEIVEYLNNRSDISYSDMVTILKELGFSVSNGTVTWD